MKTNLKFPAIFLCLLMAGCMETGQQQLTENKSSSNLLASDDSDPNARKGNVSNLIYFSVAIDDLNHMLVSDAKGDYIHGIEGISAQYNTSDGVFSFSTNNPRKTPLRKLSFPVGHTYAIDPNLSYNYSINVLANQNDIVPYKIIEIPVGESQFMSMRIWGSDDRGFVQFRLLFNLGVSEGYETDKVLVTRTADDTWTVESTDSKLLNDDFTVNPNATAAQTTKTISEFKGYYSIPFKLTLTKL
jgi:hypothetical protein